MAKNKRSKEIEARQDLNTKAELRDRYQGMLQSGINVFGEERARSVLGDEEAWIEREFSESKPQIPTGSYKDWEVVTQRYRQSFVKYAVQLAPDVIEELRLLVPLFDAIFYRSENEVDNRHDLAKHAEINLYGFLSELRVELMELGISALQNRNDYIPRPFNHDYTWGEFRALLETLASCLAAGSSHRVEVVIGREDANYRRSIFESSLGKIQYIFDLYGLRANESAADFVKLMLELINWASRHELKFDWLIDYGIDFVHQFSRSPLLRVDRVVVKRVNASLLQMEPFQFSVFGWRAGEETAADYRERVMSHCRKTLNIYFDSAYRHISRDKITKITKPIDYDRARWQVQRTILGWNKNQILDELAQLGVYLTSDALDDAFEEFRKHLLPQPQD